MEEDIKILKEFISESVTEDCGIIYGTEIQAIENILNRLEQDERVIKEMAKAWKQDDIRSVEEIIDHFRKKCEMEEDIKILKERYKKAIDCINSTNLPLFVEDTVEDIFNRLEQLEKDLAYVLNQTLGAFEKNWCIDWNFTEIREKYNIKEE